MIRLWLTSLIIVMGLSPVAIGQSSSTEALSITTFGGVIHEFQVELASTFEEKARGLMHRERLAPSSGMLFLYTKELRQSMWMKNTLIPLDMLFIRRNGRISHIHQRAVPMSLETISSRGRVLAVLELSGGTVSRLNIKVGDQINHPAFTN
jgi:uncharacterized protein